MNLNSDATHAGSGPRLITSVFITSVAAAAAALDWPAGLFAVLASATAMSAFFLGYLPVFVGFLVARSTLDAFTDVGIAIGSTQLNVPAVVAVFFLLFAGLHWIHSSLAGRRRRLRPVERLYIGWLLYLVICVWLDAVHFGDWGLGIREWTRIASIGGALYLAISFANAGYGRFLTGAVFFAVPIPVIVALWQWATGSAPLLAGVPRVRGTFYHPNTLGIFMVMCLCLTFWRVRVSRRPIIWSAALLPEAVTMIVAYSLSAIASVFISGAALGVRLKGKARIGAFVGAFLVLTAFAVSSHGAGRLGELRHTGSIRRVIESNRSTNSFTWRVWHWWVLWQRDRPYRWTGAGLGSIEPYVSPIHFAAHNDVVRMFVETGPAGLLIYIALLVALVRLIFARSEGGNPNLLATYLGAFIVSLLATSLVDNINSATAVQYYVWTLAGIVEGEHLRQIAGTASATQPLLPSTTERA